MAGSSASDGVRVDRRDREGDGHGPVVVGPGVGRALAPVVAGQEVEHAPRARRASAARPATSPARRRSSGPARSEVVAQPGAEHSDERPQLGVGVHAVAVDEGGGEVEGLVHDVAGQPRPVDALDLPGERGDHRRQGLEEQVDGLLQACVRDHPRRSLAGGCRTAGTGVRPDDRRMASMDELGRRARAASRVLAQLPTAVKDAALLAAADLLVDRTDEVLAANAEDVARAEAGGVSATVIDRLRLDARRIEAMAGGLRQVAAPGRPGRRGARRLGAAQRAAHQPGAGAARRGGDHLREPAQRHERRRRAVPEVGQRRLPARLVGRDQLQHRHRRRAARGLREGRACPADALVLVEDTSREAAVEFMQPARHHRLPHPAGRAVADRARSSSTPPCPT